ncbi:alpha/beta hydrolase-fold protein [Chondrinema litorale]|uniref:alpha/beta hydrolase-fold protein n=1 Tax=Chondrinema litorale TaxID=2994555 RepID=UPI00254271F6|nr:alpha/beta hydrolase-fold protein [Chondrinema litorale]UZR98988.1 alpha/beta hydrolase-fold protein [Chondrinema litorale]
MIYSKYLYVIFLGLSITQSFAQINVTGKVIDSNDSKPLSYVNIGIKGKNIGTTTSINGYFNILIPEASMKDTMTFSLVGYKDFIIPIQSTDNAMTVILEESVTQLDAVEITAEKLTERKFGIKRRNLLMHFADGMFQENDIFEIGQLIKLKGSKAFITSVNIYLFDSERDSATFRINFYDTMGNLPSKRIINRSIVQTHPVEKGWLKLDVTDENIFLEDDFVVSLEFLPNMDKEDHRRVSYEVKLGGSSRSFYRKNSLGTWNTPPHHYCIYVTALVDENIPEEREEVETKPSIALWSQNVKDSFNIYIKLPKGYDNKKTSPVIYCLDANAYFDHICRIIEEISEQNILEVAPIVVGIGYTNAYIMDSLRVRDYTFPVALPADSLTISGGGEHFYDFIKKELMTNINGNYRTDPKNSTLIGHSFGGYFTCFALLKDLHEEQPLFNNYIATSPSLWYNDGYLIDQFNEQQPFEARDLPYLILSIGGEEIKSNEGNDIDRFKESILALGNILLESKVYPGLGHMGVAIPSFEDAIKFLFTNTDRSK